MRRHRATARPPQASGFVLPIALLASLMLMLGSLSLQTVSLQERLRLAGLLRQRQAEDQLVSAAQQLVAGLNSQQACLLSLPLEHWAAPGLACAGAAMPLAPPAQAGPARLLQWRPGPDAAELLLELPAGGERQPARRGAFRVALAPRPGPAGPQLQAVDLRWQGLRGVTP
jgi:hypothetical protein